MKLARMFFILTFTGCAHAYNCQYTLYDKNGSFIQRGSGYFDKQECFRGATQNALINNACSMEVKFEEN